MKTKKIFFIGGLTLLALTVFFSCNTPLTLGEKLDIDGPVVEFVTPDARTAVFPQFCVEGTINDRNTIRELLLTVEKENIKYPKRWRYTGGAWQVSEDHGTSWETLPELQIGDSLFAASWNGSDKSASFVIPVDMSINGEKPEDGEYLFILQSWDLAGNSDDNSFKTRVYIIDNNPPFVKVDEPFLYVVAAGQDIDPNTDLGAIHMILDTDERERKDPTKIGKFLTQDFQLRWQIDENVSIRSLDIYFYAHDEYIDGDFVTEPPVSYIFKYHKDITTQNGVKPNGHIDIPALTMSVSSGVFPDGGSWELKNPITAKTTIKVVTVCSDIADNINIVGDFAQEKVLGYFVYWPLADEPWIVFPDAKMIPVSTADKATYATTKDLEEATYMIFPGRSIDAKSFHAYGLERVDFSLYAYNADDRAIGGLYSEDYRQSLRNIQKTNGKYSTMYDWGFEPPPRTGFYVLEAQAFSRNNQSEVYRVLFRVQDITFPNFPVEPSPHADDPLYKAIWLKNGESTITLSGTVSDATELQSLNMVWINPASLNFSAMSQLQYFRDSSYRGWADAANQNLGSSKLEPATQTEINGVKYPYDPANRNRLWNIAFTGKRMDNETLRYVWDYTIDIPLRDLNILGSSTSSAIKDLESQVFLLKVENPTGKSTIITYAPQGDVLPPSIVITNVVIDKSGDKTECIPGTYNEVPQFEGGETITINGTWEEDSTGSLAVQNYLYNKIKFSINEREITPATPGAGVVVRMTPASGNATSGTFEVVATVGAGNLLNHTQAYMKDTLVVTASVTDIGGNPREHMGSWLVASDTLRFLRISSEGDDKAYRTGETVEIFIEFNKPVKLKAGRNNNPVLVINTAGGAAGRATYKAGQVNENVRQYFTYTVTAGQTASRLTVTGISIDGGTTAITGNSTNTWQPVNYPFTWEHKPAQGITEEVRLTMDDSHTQATQGNPRTANGLTFYARKIPTTTTTTASDYPYTLGGAKRIEIDTTAPYITGITATPAGWHKAGVDIYITATFSEPVNKGAATPYLILNTGGASPNNQTNTVPADDVRVNGNRITFTYTVKSGDNTGTTGTGINITGFGGDILDVPGTAMTEQPNITLTSVHLDNIVPSAPVVTVWSSATAGTGTQIGSTNDTTNFPAVLGNRYDSALSVRIAGTAGDANFERIEYELTTGGSTKTSTTNSTVSENNLNNGTYSIRAKQIDKAGNESAWSTPVTFNLDKGNLITSITSTSANGDYTYNTNRQDRVNITVNFRKPLTFSGSQSITLNVRNGTATTKTHSENISGTNVSQISFTYPLVNGDNTNDANLNVTALSLSATDGTPAVAVPVAFMGVPAVANNLGTTKAIKLVTGALTITTQPAFSGGALAADGSYTATLRIVFNRAIYKKTGNIEIIQSATDYRIPAVLTEAQSSKFISGITTFGTYYSRGTNGYISGTGTDTSTKYVLAYNFDPTSPTTGAQTTFTEAFRQAEKVSIPVTASAVSISGSTLNIALTGSNALQVPGATYTITIPAGLVQDSFSNDSPAPTTTSLTASGFVARPFVRVQRAQDTVVIRTGGATTSAIRATQPLTANVRLDSRTPGTTIRYATADATTNVSASNQNNWNATVDPPADTDTPATPTRPGAPTNASTAYSAPFEIGAVTGNDYATRLTNVQGYQWRIRARAFVGNTASEDSDEIAYRSVLTYQINGMDVNDGEAGQNITSGNHVWIRGGDAIGSSNIPGFPLTWEDDWQTLSIEKRRAGIRVMDLVTATTGLATTSTWRWVTWEINAPAYFDFILSNDAPTNNTTNTEIITQYGPQSFAYQRAGWTSFKVNYRLNPGKHRWMYVDGASGTGPGFGTSKGRINFARPFMARPTMTATYP